MEFDYPWEQVASRYLDQSVCNKLKNTYDPLPSPYGLLQERLYRNPWALLVATIFLNKTPAKSAKSILYQFLKLYPIPELLLSSGTEEVVVKKLSVLLTPLGLQNRRAKSLFRLASRLVQLSSEDYIDLHVFQSKLQKLPGVGTYSYHSWLLFHGVQDDAWSKPELGITDKKLILYSNWRANVVQNS